MAEVVVAVDRAKAEAEARKLQAALDKRDLERLEEEAPPKRHRRPVVVHGHVVK